MNLLSTTITILVASKLAICVLCVYIDDIKGFWIWFWFILILSLPFDFTFFDISIMLQMVWRRMLSVIIGIKLVMWESRLPPKILTIYLIIIAYLSDFKMLCSNAHGGVILFGRSPLWTTPSGNILFISVCEALIGLLNKSASYWRNRLHWYWDMITSVPAKKPWSAYVASHMYLLKTMMWPKQLIKHKRIHTFYGVS